MVAAEAMPKVREPHLRSCQQDQEAGEHARWNVYSGQPWDQAAKKHAAQEGDPE